MLVPYVGGPVIRCPAVYNSFWGPSWGDVTHQTLAKQINQFTQDLLASNFMNILTQYGELLGAGSGAFIRASSLPGVQSVLTVQSYQQIIQQCINAGAFPQAVDLNAALSIPMLMIYLDEHTVINGGGRQLNFPGAPDLAYHDSFVTANGHPCVYAFMAFLPLNELTWVASHEFAEAVTDPLYNAWTPDHAFHEIGDYCEGNNSSITVSGRTWTVQTIWSDTNNACIVPPAAPIYFLVRVRLLGGRPVMIERGAYQQFVNITDVNGPIQHRAAIDQLPNSGRRLLFDDGRFQVWSPIGD